MATEKRTSLADIDLRVQHDWVAYSLWIAAAGILGFAIPAIFSSGLQMPRNWFLLPYSNVVVAVSQPVAYRVDRVVDSS